MTYFDCVVIKVIDFDIYKMILITGFLLWGNKLGCHDSNLDRSIINHSSIFIPSTKADNDFDWLVKDTILAVHLKLIWFSESDGWLWCGQNKPGKSSHVGNEVTTSFVISSIQSLLGGNRPFKYITLWCASMEIAHAQKCIIRVLSVLWMS